MAWYDNVGSWFGGGDGSNWADTIGSGFDYVDGGNDTGWMDTALDFFNAGSGDSGGGSWWDTALDWLSSDNGNGSTNGGNIFGAMLGGLGGAAQAYLDKDAVKEAGIQKRRTLDYTASLEDYYKQQDKARKRTALDTYGQFSLMDRWAPNYVNTPPVQVPDKPKA